MPITVKPWSEVSEEEMLAAGNRHWRVVMQSSESGAPKHAVDLLCSHVEVNEQGALLAVRTYELETAEGSVIFQNPYRTFAAGTWETVEALDMTFDVDNLTEIKRRNNEMAKMQREQDLQDKFGPGMPNGLPIMPGPNRQQRRHN